MKRYNQTCMRTEDNQMEELAELYKLFGDSTRVKILYLLLGREMCVRDIAEGLDMTQSAISHQLKTLRMGKLIKARRDGKQMYYSLSDDHVRTILEMGIDHLTEEG